MKVRVKYQDKVLYQNILVADNMFDRLIGLMFRNAPKGDGLLLVPSNSIHTFFMKYALDVVFLSKENKIVKIIRELKPWRQTWIYFRASKVLEVPSGSLIAELKEGDILEVENV